MLTALRRLAAGKPLTPIKLQLLIEEGYATHDEYGSITLTTKGIHTLGGRR